MADCWSCGAEQRNATFCPTCNKIQPPAARASHFEVLGLEPRMAQDRATIEKRFREVSQRVHPDRFARGSSVERRIALLHTERVNQAYRALRAAQSRAEHLMEIAHDAPPEGSKARDPDFLMEMLELQESVDARDEDGLETLLGDIRMRMRQHYARLASHFDEGSGTPGQAVDALDELRYLRRLEERIEHRLEEV